MKHIQSFEGFLNEGNLVSFDILKKAVEQHEDGSLYYDETRLKNIFNQLDSKDQTRARKEYSKYFGK
jgi:hypothetical protein